MISIGYKVKGTVVDVRTKKVVCEVVENNAQVNDSILQNIKRRYVVPAFMLEKVK